MKVSECMTRGVRTISPDRPIQEAATVMGELDVGAVPVAENERLVGMITDRDIAVRAVATGQGPGTTIRDVMTKEVRYCYEDEDIDHVARNMADIQVRRLPVVDRDKNLTGILSIGDVACAQTDRATVGDALGGISRNGGQHTTQPAAH